MVARPFGNHIEIFIKINISYFFDFQLESKRCSSLTETKTKTEKREMRVKF